MSKGFSLNLNSKNVLTFQQENELYAGQEINLKFSIDGLIKVSQTFKTGQDIEWVKKCVSEKLECSRADFDLSFNGEVMHEFFSLSDIQQLKSGSEIQVLFKK